jgi:hypothetical protein
MYYALCAQHLLQKVLQVMKLQILNEQQVTQQILS